MKLHASEVTFIFIFFLPDSRYQKACLGLTQNAFFDSFFLHIPLPPAVQDGVVVITNILIWQKGMVISLSLPHQFQTNSPPRIRLP